MKKITNLKLAYKKYNYSEEITGSFGFDKVKENILVDSNKIDVCEKCKHICGHYTLDLHPLGIRMGIQYCRICKYCCICEKLDELCFICSLRKN